jgi:hypothetical protein
LKVFFSIGLFVFSFFIPKFVSKVRHEEQPRNPS